MYSSILKSAGVEHLEGRGVVLDPHTVEVRGTDGSVRQLSTRHILIATGGHAEKLGIPGAEHAITSDEGLVLDDFGERPIVVVGGGYIAVELAGIFHGLGAPTHIMFRAEAPLRGFDEECRHAVLENLGLSGMTVHASCRPQKIERLGPRHLRLHYLDSQDREQSVECGTVLMATGRKPNTRGLGLEVRGEFGHFANLGDAGEPLVMASVTATLLSDRVVPLSAPRTPRPLCSCRTLA